jgi:branched-chain amino acid aminotransferase
MQRAFLYGDLVFETMLWENGQIRFFNLHMERLHHSFSLLQFEDNIDEHLLHQTIAARAKYYDKARVRLTFYRDADGFYLPQNNQTAFEVEIYPIKQHSEMIDLVGIYRGQYKSCSSLSNLKSGNALVYVLASLYVKQQQWNDAIILNEHGRICEATSSNIIIKLDGAYITPPLSEGCVDGIYRKACLQQLDNRFPHLIELPITLENLGVAHEIWLCNAINGPRKVGKLLLS